MIELKPCPFCHYQNHLKKAHIVSRRLPFWWFIECDNCHYCGKTKLFLFRAVKSWNMMAETVKDQLDKDEVEIVRCKDCKYLMFSDCYGECTRNHLGIVRPDNYCSRGKRKEGADNA